MQPDALLARESAVQVEGFLSQVRVVFAGADPDVDEDFEGATPVAAALDCRGQERVKSRANRGNVVALQA